MTSARIVVIAVALTAASLVTFSSRSSHSKAESLSPNSAGSSFSSPISESMKGNRRSLLNGARTFSVNLASPYNDPPVAEADTLVVHGVTGLESLLANDHDPDGDHFSFGGFPTLPQHGQIFFNLYFPELGYTGADSFTYRICDLQSCSSPANVTVDVRNQAPIANDDTYQVHGRTVIGPFFQNDSDPENDALSLDPFVTNPLHGQLLNTNTQDSFSYIPEFAYTGSDSFTYKVCDSLRACSTAVVILNITNAPPTPKDKRIRVRGNTVIHLLLGDTDPEDDDIFVINCCLTSPEHGGLFNTAIASAYEYRPAAGFTGTDGFIYRECDSLGACTNGSITLDVVGNGGDLGATSCNANIGAPINVTNGNMYLQQGDYRLPGVGPMIDVTRTYNSMSASAGLFGRGWSSAYDESIVSYDADLARFNQADGRAVYLGRVLGSSGPLVSADDDFYGQLTQSGGGFTLTMKDGSVHLFNSAGRLTALADRNGNQTTLAYDANGHLTSITDTFGRVLTFTPDSNGQVLSISDSIGTVASYSYGGSGALLSVTYADNSSFGFAYDGAARLTSVTDALGNIVEAHTYDSQGRALTSERDSGVEHYDLSYVSATETDVTDALGHVSKYTFDSSKGRNVVTQVEGLCSCGGGSGSQVLTWTYDARLNVTAKTDGLGHTTSYTYDNNGNRLTETDALGTDTYSYNQFAEVLTLTDKMGGVMTNTYSTTGDLLTVNDALNHPTTMTYDSHGQVLTVTDARGKVTTFSWDSSGRLSQHNDALNHHTNLAYDARARLTSVTNALSEVTSYQYDAAGRLQKITFPDTNFTGFTYDLAGRRTIVTDARGHNTIYAYDGASRLTSLTDALNDTTSFGYDLMSNQTSMTDALARETNYEYDDFNRLKKVIYPAATAGATRLHETVEYDAAGNVKNRTDTAGRVTTYLYDDVNRLTQVTDPAAQVTQFEYNARSQTTGLLDALTQHYTFTYDPLGRQTGMTRAGVSMSYGYDAVGNRTSRTDYNGATTTYAFDDLNRLTTIAYPNSTTATYGYDELSRLASGTNENGTVSFTYDNRGRLASTTDVFDQTLEYSYDENGNRTGLTLGGSAYAAYAYDNVNRLTDLSDNAAVIANYEYDPTNELTRRTLINGQKSTYQYDDLNRLTRLSTGKRADSEYVYNTANQIVQQTENAGEWAGNFSYDQTDRLTGWTQTAPDPYAALSSDPSRSGLPNGHRPVEAYSYDGVGNRTAATGVGSSNYTYGAFNRLTSTNVASYGHDNNGNRTAKTVNNASSQYTWDFENRLKQVTQPDLPTVNYKYDALGRRIQRSTSNGNVLNFVYDGDDVIADLDSDGNTVTSYLNGPGIDNKVRQTDANGNLYYVTDQLGSTISLTDDGGSTVEEIGYDSFGQSTAVHFTRYTYTGREFDADTGLYYYRARWYDAQTGRFISEDPIGLSAGPNLYEYAYDNPLYYVDPTGNQPWPQVALAGGGTLTTAASTGALGAAAAAAAPVTAVVVVGGTAIYGAWHLGVWLAERPWNPLTHPADPPWTPMTPSRPFPQRPTQPMPPPPPISMAKGGKKNIQNEISDLMKRQYGNNKDLICKALDELYRCADSAMRLKIKVAQKYFGCRTSSGGGGR